jgi:hypothetical protein
MSKFDPISDIQVVEATRKCGYMDEYVRVMRTASSCLRLQTSGGVQGLGYCAKVFLMNGGCQSR